MAIDAIGEHHGEVDGVRQENEFADLDVKAFASWRPQALFFGRCDLEPPLV